MFIYKIYNKIMTSDIEFKGLVSADNAFSESNLPEDAIHVYLDDIKGKFRPDEMYAEISGDECFFANSFMYMYISGHDIVYEPKQGSTADTAKKFILGYGMAMYFYRYGQVAMHCSCVSRDGKAYMISGKSGAGKSTVTNLLLDDGFTLMADDVAVIREESGVLCATPAFPYQKLCKDAAEEKNYDVSSLDLIDENRGKYIVPYEADFSTEPVPVKALIVLEKYSEKAKAANVICKEVQGGDKLLPCLDNLFIAPLLGEKKKDVFTVMPCIKLASAISVFSIARPVVGDTLDEVYEAVQECISKCREE